jgi:hypothetical protein
MKLKINNITRIEVTDTPASIFGGKGEIALIGTGMVLTDINFYDIDCIISELQNLRTRMLEV